MAAFMRSGPPVALLLALLSGSAARAGETVSLKVGRETVRAYLAKPASSASAAGLVVLHEMWGLNEQIMGAADRLSRSGYVALAPDLYGGKLAADPGLALEMMRALDDDKALAIVRQAIAYLRTLDGNSRRPVGTIGFDMGGRLSLAAALQGADVQATVVIYGKVVTTREALAPIKAPVMGIFAGRDPSIPNEDVKKFEAALKESGKDVKILMNDGIGHAFMNEDRADFEPEYSKDAWVIMRKWLAAKLNPGVPEAPETDEAAAAGARP